MDSSGFSAPAAGLLDTQHADLPGALLRLLSDGQPRSRAKLADFLQCDALALEEALKSLVKGGLRVTDDASGLACAAFVPLDALTIEAACMAHALDAEVHVSTMIGSTNSTLLSAFRRGETFSGYTILAAEMQLSGRGRKGRVWHAAPGASLAVSFARVLPLRLSALSGFSLLCGLAVSDALVMRGVELELKWPNDLLSAGGKLGGILIETHQLDKQELGVVIGVGLNVSADEERSHQLAQREQAMPATDLCAAGAQPPVDRNQLIADLALFLDRRIDAFLAHGFGHFVKEWNALHAFKDEQISLIEDGAVLLSGVARGVDQLGRLVVQTPQGLRTVVAGDVSVRTTET
jgi:BirA family biotin operon repressor/biotin-[acetyl-CoA-carboxylase] ligase